MMSSRHGWGWQPTQTIYCIYMRHIQSVWSHWYAVHWCMVKALHSYNHTTWLRFWGTGSLVESKWYHYVMVEADSHLRLLPTSIWDIYKVFSTSICCPLTYGYFLTQLLPHYLAQILGYWVTCRVKTMSLSHGWGWRPPQTICCIHMNYIQSVWAHWHADHRHTVPALNS